MLYFFQIHPKENMMEESLWNSMTKVLEIIPCCPSSIFCDCLFFKA